MLKKNDPIEPKKIEEEKKKDDKELEAEEEEAEEEEEEDEEEQPTLVENTVKPDNKETPSKAPEDKKSVLASILEGSPKAI
jgi:hypothetical protein